MYSQGGPTGWQDWGQGLAQPEACPWAPGAVPPQLCSTSSLGPTLGRGKACWMLLWAGHTPGEAAVPSSQTPRGQAAAPRQRLASALPCLGQTGWALLMALQTQLCPFCFSTKLPPGSQLWHSRGHSPGLCQGRLGVGTRSSSCPAGAVGPWHRLPGQVLQSPCPQGVLRAAARWCQHQEPRG